MAGTTIKKASLSMFMNHLEIIFDFDTFASQGSGIDHKY